MTDQKHKNPKSLMPENQAKKQGKAGRGIINEKMKKVQFKKGQSGNPKGRPKKGSAIADILNEIGKETIEVDGRKITKREAVMKKVYAEAIKGNNWAVQFIADRTEGKAIDRIILPYSDDEMIVE